jgi:hypothetical protein
MQLKLCALLSLSLTACSTRDAPDPYYLQIQGVRLAVPKSYIDSGISVELNGNRKEVREIASTPPGLAVDSLHMWLNGIEATPWNKNAEIIGIADQAEVRVFAPNTLRPVDLPEAITARVVVEERRSKKYDEFGLLAYEAEYRSPDISINYIGKLDSTESLTIICTGFNMPNPGCLMTTKWRGLVVEYRFRHVYLSQWKSAYANLINRFNSFTYQQ